MPSQQLNSRQQIQASPQQQCLVVQQLKNFHQNLYNHILQNQIQNQLYDHQAKVPQIFIHEVESLCSQQVIDQKDQRDQRILGKQYSTLQHFKALQQQAQQTYQIKISQVQSIKSLQDNQKNDCFNCKAHLISEKDQSQQNLQTNQKKNQQCNQKKQIVENNKLQQKTKQNKTYFQTRYHQRVSSNRKSYQTKKDETVQNNKSTLNVKQNKQKNFRKSKQNSSSTQFQKMNVLNNLNLNVKSQTMLSNLKTQDKMPLLILNKSKTKQTLGLKPQISLNGPVQKMKDILQDRNYNNNLCENQKENTGPISRKIIKRSPYGLLEIIVKKQKRQSNLSKITNLRILKPGQLKKINKKSRIQLLGKSCDAKVQQLDQFLIKKQKQQKIIDSQLLSPPFLKF